jgi:hypothetical protein
MAKLHYANKLANLLCNITNELVVLWQDQRPQVVELVGSDVNEALTSRQRQRPRQTVRDRGEATEAAAIFSRQGEARHYSSSRQGEARH